jgi:surface antigen
MTNGLADFENHFGGVHWGNAEHWDKAASDLGYLVDDVPAVGAVAQTDDGRVGHVAWVSAVGDGTVTVEEYNMAVAGGYDVRTVPTSSFRYLHLDDTAPAPYLGSSRAAVATTDAHGATWSVSTTGAGDLLVHRPSGHVVRLGGLGAWSAHAAPAVATDAQGRIWVAAVAVGGSVLAAHTAPGSVRFSHPRRVLTASPTSSPALVLDGQGHVRIFAVDASGTLRERHTSSGGWSHALRLGKPGSWSTHTAPAAVADRLGDTWVAAVTRHGALLSRHTTRGGRHWTRMRPVDHASWSSTSTPALTSAADGRVWLAAVGSRGDLEVRHTAGASGRWQRPVVLSGSWSTYASPSLTTDRSGRVWLASVTSEGDLAVSSRGAGKRHWQASRGLPHVPASETDSPSLTSSISGVLVGVTGRNGRPLWRQPVGPDDVLPVAHGPHGGGFSVSPFL